MHILDLITVNESNQILLHKLVPYLDKNSKQYDRLLFQIHFYPIVELCLDLSESPGIPGPSEHPFSVQTLSEQQGKDILQTKWRIWITKITFI